MKNIMLKKKMPLAAATWTDAFRRVCNRIALVAAAICAAAAPSQSFAVNEPDEYLEYVQSDGNQYIDTGLYPYANMTIEADIDIISGGDVVGCSNYESYPITVNNGYIAGRLLSSGYATTDVPVNSGRKLIVSSGTLNGKLTISVNGVVKAQSGSNCSREYTGKNMYVFAGKDGTKCSAKLYGLKIYINNELVRDFVPARKGGVAGLYDCQNDEWYPPNSGTLIAGPVVIPELKERFHTYMLGRFAKRAQDFDVGAYVQDGLIAHFDGIRNAGADQPHDSSATTWVNLGSGGSANDATLTTLDSNVPSGASAGEWTDSGYYFKGSQYFALGGTISLGKAASFQVVSDYATSMSDYSSYPALLGGCSSDSDQFVIWHDKGKLANMNFKVLNNKKSADNWDGYLLNVIYDGASSRCSISQGAAYNWITGSASGDISSQNTTYAIGTAGKTNSYKGPRTFNGIIKSVRIYNQILTEAQLAQNWYIDEMRFRGAFTADDVDIVIATNQEGIEGVEPSGEYMVNGSHTFSAANVWVGDNEWAPTGYTLYKWDGSDWTFFAISTDTSFAYTNCLANGKMRLTWNFEQQAARGARLVHRWSFTSDYTDSVGGTPNGSLWGNPSFANGQVTFPGGSWGSGSVDLGASLTSGGDTTIEIWAKNNALSAAEIMFEYGAPNNNYGGWGGSKQCFAYYWSDENAQGNDIFIVKKGDYTSYSSKSGIMPATVGTMYHFSFTFKADGNGGTVVNFARRNATTGALEASGTHTVPNWTLSHLESQTPSFSLNISKEPQYKPTANAYNGSTSRYSDSSATYDEVRIWNGVLSDDQLAANASMGPDVYTSGFEEGFRLADNAVFNIPADGYAASGDVVLGAGSKLRFDTSSMHYDEPVSFSATGFNIPSGSILDYVEPQDSANFSVTFSENTITVTRLRQNEPDAYLEYVESDGRQYVETSLNPNANMTIEADIDIISGGDVVGCSNYESYPITVNNGYLAGRLLRSGFATTDIPVPTGRKLIVSSGTLNGKLTISVDGVVKAQSGGTCSVSTTGKSMYVFAAKDGLKCSAKLYGMKIYINGVLERDYVPGIKNTVAGLYDRQNDAWYHSGSGIELIPGPVVNPQNLPDAYLDYVKSTGAQWVSVGVPLTQTMKFDVDVDWISGNTLIGQNSYFLFPLRVDSGTIRSRWWMADAAASADTGVALDTGRRRFVVTTSSAAKLSVSVDGGTPALSGGKSDRSDVNPSDLYLFAKHYGGGTGVDEYSTAKLYGLKIYGSNGGLVRDYVPGIKDDVVGLYDRVNDKFVKSGSGTPLVAGPVVDRSKPDAFVEYVESNGSQWVDTGVDGRPGVKSEADIDWISGAPLGVVGNGHCLLLQGLGGDKIGGQAHYSQETVTTVAVNSGRHVVVSEACAGSKMTITVDGTTSAESPDIVYNYDTGATIWMFAAHHYNGGAWGAGRSKFYELKLWRTGSDGVRRIQRHFIPCVKDGRAGLYDAVSGVIFYSHSGTDLAASSTTRTLSVWRNEADDASLDTAANWCGGLPNGTDAVVCAPWLPAVSSASGLAVSNLTVTGGNLAFADGTNTVAGTLTADGALAFTNLVINGSADCAVAISGFISGHGTVTSLTLDEGARFVPDGTGYLTITDALVGTMLIDMTDINLSGETGRFPLFKTGTAEILPTADAVEFVGGRAPSGRLLLKVSSGFGYDLGSAGFFILLR